MAMRQFFTSIILLLSFGLTSVRCGSKPVTPSGAPMAPARSFHDFEIAGLEGGTVKMADFKGKFILCVNVASKCGYTPQYKDLEQLYQQYKDILVIVGFPCNQFMGQEPGSNEEIADFCERNYGVTFPMTTKVDVRGKDQHPIYKWLTEKSENGAGEDNVEWNFHKFLVSPDGQWIASFPTRMSPMDKAITAYLAK
jgi:glutathione peroxidase